MQNTNCMSFSYLLKLLPGEAQTNNHASFESVSSDIIFEIGSHLDPISLQHFTSASKRLRTLRPKFADLINPYKEHIETGNFKNGLRTALEKGNQPAIYYFLEIEYEYDWIHMMTFAMCQQDNGSVLRKWLQLVPQATNEIQTAIETQLFVESVLSKDKMEDSRHLVSSKQIMRHDTDFSMMCGIVFIVKGKSELFYEIWDETTKHCAGGIYMWMCHAAVCKRMDIIQFLLKNGSLGEQAMNYIGLEGTFQAKEVDDDMVNFFLGNLGPGENYSYFFEYATGAASKKWIFTLADRTTMTKLNWLNLIASTLKSGNFDIDFYEDILCRIYEPTKNNRCDKCSSKLHGKSSICSICHIDVLNSCLAKAVRGGKIDVIDYFIELGAKDMETAVRELGITGNKKVLDHLFNKGVRNLQIVILESVKNKSFNMNFMKYCAKKIGIPKWHLDKLIEEQTASEKNAPKYFYDLYMDNNIH